MLPALQLDETRSYDASVLTPYIPNPRHVKHQMTYLVYDPKPYHNEYASRMFFDPMRAYARDHAIKVEECTNLDQAKDATVVILTDHLSEERILKLKNNGCRIATFNVTDSSYFSNAIRYAPSIGLIDRIFMVSGLPIHNDSTDFVVDPDFTIRPVPCPFLPEKEWEVYHFLLTAGRLESLPYVPWEPIPDIPWTPWSQRSQKVLLRGGGHARRIILAMFLMRLGKLDCNSGMMLGFYFSDAMNPQFRFCDYCRAIYKAGGNRADYIEYASDLCTSPAYAGNKTWSLENLGFWNNRCPRSFYWMAEQFSKKHGPIDMKEMETLLNGNWITDKAHQEMLARIAFTSDLKWIHSIYMPQRFWQGASAGALNILPERTNDQKYFPEMSDGEHYLTFSEEMDILDHDFGTVNESLHEHVSGNAKRHYEQWIRPSQYPINTNLLAHIFELT
jgi:hypothetical protein